MCAAGHSELTAEVARLREALERIRAVHASGVGDIGKARRMDDIARAALAVGKGGT